MCIDICITHCTSYTHGSGKRILITFMQRIKDNDHRYMHHAHYCIKDHGYKHHGYMHHGYNIVLVTWPERSKDAKDKVKEARRTAIQKLGPLNFLYEI